MCLVLCPGSASADLIISPPEVQLQGANLRQQLLVEQAGADVTTQASYVSSAPTIIEVDEHGHLIARSQGTATIQVTVGTEQRSVPVTFADWAPDRPVDFVTEIQPLLTRYSCNSGGCHGKASGQNGFKLSLFGFDAEFDHDALVHEARGRRIAKSAPEKSLLLTKATGEVPHGGGRRIAPGSDPYETLLRWIRTGAAASAPDVPRVASLTIEPAERLFQPGQKQQLRVIARYTDDSTRDVTRQTDYASNIDVVATIDEQGLLTAGEQSGEAAIMARYMGQVAVFRAIRPHGQPRQEISGFKPLNEIDRLAITKWQKLGLLPSPTCDDATFLRRTTIDLGGRLPRPEEVRQFLADSAPNKREQLVDRLLASSDYPAYFALKWSVILRNSRLAG
ncbi:MAG: DUF1549 domain-containing protein, partial [Planctomycetaceae bacterium]|nr:DUF1549 domain-containing protein [Planctomycetaceae bacterium]